MAIIPTDLTLKDVTWDINGLFTQSQQTVYQPVLGERERIPLTEQLFSNAIGTTVVYLSARTEVNERSVYTYFDLVGDIGGLQGFLMSFAQVILFLTGVFSQFNSVLYE